MGCFFCARSGSPKMVFLLKKRLFRQSCRQRKVNHEVLRRKTGIFPQENLVFVLKISRFQSAGYVGRGLVIDIQRGAKTVQLPLIVGRSHRIICVLIIFGSQGGRPFFVPRVGKNRHGTKPNMVFAALILALLRPKIEAHNVFQLVGKRALRIKIMKISHYPRRIWAVCACKAAPIEGKFGACGIGNLRAERGQTVASLPPNPLPAVANQ